MSAIFPLIEYVQNELGYSPWATGMRFLPLTVVLFIAALVGGVLIAKVPHRFLIASAALSVAVGLAVFKPLIHAGGGWTELLPTMVFLGLGLGMFNPPRTALFVSVVNPLKAGASSGPALRSGSLA